jgi:hypothetical protein
METAEFIRAKAAECRKSAQDSFERCDTDGFLSQWASGITAEQYEKQAQIVDNGGVWEFPALFNLDGTRARAKLIRHYNKFSYSWDEVWSFYDMNNRFIGKFITAFPKRASTMEKKGYREGYEDAPAKATILGSGYGLSGNAWAAIVRTDKGYPEEAK